MNFKIIFRLFTLALMLVVFSLSSFSQGKASNSLSQIVVDKPMDNNYMLELFFNNEFSDNAFLQKRGNGSYYVFIPDTEIKSKKIKLIYGDKVSQNDVKIEIEEQPYVKETGESKYVRLSVETPVNSDIQLSSNTIEEKTKPIYPFAKLYTLLVSVLLLAIAIIAISIYNKVKQFNPNFGNIPSFPIPFLKEQKQYKKISKNNVTYEQPVKMDESTIISPVSAKDFSCFDLPVEDKETLIPFTSAINKSVVTQPIENRIIPIKTIVGENMQNILEHESELDLPSAQMPKKPDENDEIYRPELISELKISSNKGFYLTTVGESDFALFGYTGDKIFFLQKFTELTQINLQARFYDNKDDSDLYIIRLDSYKAMVSVSDTEIKELAVI